MLVRWLQAAAAVVALAAGMLFATSTFGSPASADETPRPGEFELVLFWGDGCPHCAEEHEWLETVREQYPDLTITEYEVWHDPDGLAEMERWAAHYGFEPGAVPVTVIGDRVWVGFSGPYRSQMESALVQLQAGQTPSSASDAAAVSVPFLGEISLDDSSLVFSTLVIGFVDGVNPCSLWVISMLLAIVVRTGSRRRVITVGTVFLVVTAGMYALYMAGIYSALSVIGHLGAIQIAVAAIAGIFGVVSVKDYFAYKKGISFTIPESSKPTLYRRMRAAAGTHDLVPALAATVGLAVGVSLLETPCTAGFPVLWTGLLAAQGVSTGEAVALFGLYMVPFLLDELLVFGLAVATMRATKMQEKHGRLLKLVAGTTMLALAGTVLLRPETMNDPVQALAVFAGAFLLAWMVHRLFGPRLEEPARVEEVAVGEGPTEHHTLPDQPWLSAKARSPASAGTRRRSKDGRGSR